MEWTYLNYQPLLKELFLLAEPLITQTQQNTAGVSWTCAWGLSLTVQNWLKNKKEKEKKRIPQACTQLKHHISRFLAQRNHMPCLLLKLLFLQATIGSPSSHMSGSTMPGHLAHQNLSSDFIIQPTDPNVSFHWLMRLAHHLLIAAFIPSVFYNTQENKSLGCFRANECNSALRTSTAFRTGDGHIHQNN